MRYFDQPRWRRPGFALAVILLIGAAWVFLLDSLVFRSTLYYEWLDPDSTAGSAWHATRETKSLLTGQRNVLLLGDSRLNHGFSAPLANVSARAEGLNFVKLAVNGSSYIVAYFMLRDLDPKHDLFTAIGIGTPSLRDDDESVQSGEMDRSDFVYVIPFLRLSDLARLPWPWSDGKIPWLAVPAILLPGQALQADLQRFLEHPLQRIRKVEQFEKTYREQAGDYPTPSWVMPPLRVLTADPRYLIGDPLSGATEDYNPRTLKRSFRSYSASIHSGQDSKRLAYNRRWLGSMAEPYWARGKPLLVYLYPRGPYHRQLVGPLLPHGSLLDLERDGVVKLLPWELFVSLEEPQYFDDYYHLNQDGKRLYSPLLAEAFMRAIGRPLERAR
jgi:hypothetical protein